MGQRGSKPDAFDLDDRLEQQRREIVQLKIRLLDQAQVQSNQPSSPTTFARNRKVPSDPPESVSISKTPRHEKNQCVNPSDAETDFDLLNRVLRLFQINRQSTSRQTVEENLLLLEAFGDASIAVLHTCLHTLDQIARDALFSHGENEEKENDNHGILGWKASRNTHDTIRWIAGLFMDMEIRVREIRQGAVCTVWEDKIKPKINQQLLKIGNLMLEVYISACRSLAGLASSASMQNSRNLSSRKAIDLRDSFLSLTKTIFNRFQCDVTISLSTNILKKIKPLVWKEVSKINPSLLSTPMYGYLHDSPENQIENHKRQCSRLEDLARQESVAYLVEALHALCNGYLDPEIILQKDGIPIESIKSARLSLTNLEKLQQRAGELLERLWKTEEEIHETLSQCKPPREGLSFGSGKTFDQLDSPKVESVLDRSSQRALISVLERVWSL